jgi:hypothetical protein
MLRGSFKNGKGTMSFMQNDGEIYVWGIFELQQEKVIKKP